MSVMMSKTGIFHPLQTTIKPPERFTYPFFYEPHPLTLLAAKALQRELATMVLTEGKMFGVLVVKDSCGTLGFLAAYSGLLEGRNNWPYFVPPVFDAQQPDGHFKLTEREISSMTAESQRDERRQRSQALQQWLFDQYRLLNAAGQQKDVVHIWQDYHCSPRIRNKYPLPPGGTGDCCAPKLLQYAYFSGLKPLCMAEFWWGPSPKTERQRVGNSTSGLGNDESGMVRQHGQFYPACRGKCKPLLTWMLQGLNVDPNPEEQTGQPLMDIQVVYEDDSLVVVNKPSGLLSVPGRIGNYSVATILHERYPDSLLAHRLDMGTSGLLVVAKNRSVYAALQQQFTSHTVRKRYVALLDTALHPLPPTLHQTGRIELPLLSDPVNRPRQVVDYERGKPAVTDYEMLDDNRIALYPLTGRTHQLRMHCAHPDGLGCPILGDELYGKASDRLYLHAERLELTHPITGQHLRFEQPAPF
jgi:tRNA pseudouridine32 synthase/23S rRNA pseudouridine746 synthase